MKDTGTYKLEQVYKGTKLPVDKDLERTEKNEDTIVVKGIKSIKSHCIGKWKKRNFARECRH